jgi:hypothetical protein
MRGPYLAGQQSSAESLQFLLHHSFKLPYNMDIIRCALWAAGISSGELSLALGSPRGSTTALWRLNAIFTHVLHLFVFRTILLPTLLANLGWNLPIHLCGWNSDTISLVEPHLRLLFLLTNRARGLRGDQSSPWGMELLFPAEIRNRSNTFIFAPNLSLCIWYVWPSAVAAKNVCQRYHGCRP